MTKETIYTLASPYRDDFKVEAYRFGNGKHSLAVVGAIRGDEIEQQYTCARLIKILTELEQEGALVPGYEIVVIPSVNPFSMNIGKRFWSMDNTDINRMFPGYDKGETTQRIAAALFDCVKDYEYGIQMASYYIPGEFIPHVRMLNTGYQPEKEARSFGLPYVYVKEVSPYDTALLNYNWQIWGTKAFSVYTGNTERLNAVSVENAVEALLRFMVNMGLLSITIRPGYHPQTITNADLISIKSNTSGVLHTLRCAESSVRVGDLLAEVVDPYDGSIREQIVSPVNGVIFFNHERPLVIEGAKVFEIVEDRVI
ncbi:MAG: M14 family metallopeptidase [Rikenellaceae bacterium]